nr:Rrf2 family transcriptional regulator [Halorussus ruber]
MTEKTPPDSVEDVDAAVADEWKDQTTPYERVREVVSRTYEPASAEEVADDALTSPKTARKHLETLASDGFVATTASETGGTRYRRAPDSLVLEQATDLLSEVSVDELQARASEMRCTLQDFQNRYDAQSPDDLSIDLTNETLGESPSRDEPDSEEITEWRTTRRNLALVNAALSIANARKFVTDDGSRSGRGAISHGD